MNKKCLFLSTFLLLESSNAFLLTKQAQYAKGVDMMATNGGGNDIGERRDFLTTALATTAVIFSPSMAMADEDSTTTLHILDYPVQGNCGEAKVSEKGVFFAKTFGKLVDGSCATEGYTNAEGSANGTGEKDSQRTYDIYGK